MQHSSMLILLFEHGNLIVFVLSFAFDILLLLLLNLICNYILRNIHGFPLGIQIHKVSLSVDKFGNSESRLSEPNQNHTH